MKTKIALAALTTLLLAATVQLYRTTSKLNKRQTDFKVVTYCAQTYPKNVMECLTDTYTVLEATQ